MNKSEDLEIFGKHFATGLRIGLQICNGKIKAIKELKEYGNNIGGPLYWIVPGLIDMQINGFAGNDLNKAYATEEERIESIRMMTVELLMKGTTSFCPTVITGSFDWMRNALEGIHLACERNSLVDQCVAGIHLEGPYISEEDGPRGAHPAKAVKDPDWGEFMALQNAAGGRICMVTLAPERKGALEMIARLVKSGIRVSIGHTSASYEDIHLAINAGATVSTHLGNGSHAVLPRHPHYIWAQLAEDRLWASIIADGHHLHSSVIKVMARAKGEKLFLVSDAAHLAGMEPGIYDTHIGGKVELLSSGRLQTTADSRVLAGSSAALIECVEAFMQFTGNSFEDSIRKATEVPAKLLQNPRIGNLNVGSYADLLLIDWEAESNKINLMKVYKRGAEISPVRNK